MMDDTWRVCNQGGHRVLGRWPALHVVAPDSVSLMHTVETETEVENMMPLIVNALKQKTEQHRNPFCAFGDLLEKQVPPTGHQPYTTHEQVDQEKPITCPPGGTVTDDQIDDALRADPVKLERLAATKPDITFGFSLRVVQRAQALVAATLERKQALITAKERLRHEPDSDDEEPDEEPDADDDDEAEYDHAELVEDTSDTEMQEAEEE